MSFPSPITSLNLCVTQGSTTFEQSIPSATLGSNTVLVTNTNLINAFDNQPPGTIFNPSIVTTYDAGSLPSGDTLSTPSVLNFVPEPLILSNFGPFSYDFVSGGSGTFILPEPSSNSTSPGAFTYSVVGSTGIVSISANVVTMLSAGTTIIRATQAAAGGYTSAYVEASVTVAPIAPTFSNGGIFTISSKNFGDASFTPAYPTSKSSGAFAYTSSAPSVATVHPTTGVVTIVSIGSTTIRATQAAAGGYTSAYVEASFNVMTWSQRGLDIGGESAGDYSGWSVSLSSDGNTVAIGALYNDGGGANSGHTRIYDWDTISTPNKWTKRGLDINGEAAGDYSGISVSLSSNGNTVAIGAVYNDSAGSNAGHVRVYYWDTVATPNKWTKRGLDIDGEAAGDFSGVSVSLSSNGNTLAVGAHYNDASGNLLSDAGHVRVYDWNTIAWTKRGSDIDGEAANDQSGVSVSLSSNGNTVAIGGRYNDGVGSDAGHARVYDWDTVSTPNMWIQRGSNINGEAAGDYSGWSVSLSSNGNTVAVGAIYNDASGNILSAAGHVRIYDWNVSEWIQRGLDIDGEAAGDNSGWSVSLSSDGNRIAIGAIYNDASGNLLSDAGHVRVYQWNQLSSTWTQLGLDIDGEATGDNSGRSVRLSSDGNTVAIGATLNDSSFSNAGHVRVFKYQ